MSARIEYNSGPFTLRDGGTSVVRPWIDIHIESREVETQALYWPKRADRPGCDPYISMSTACDSGEVTTYMSVEQATAMRDALTAALSEAGECVPHGEPSQAEREHFTESLEDTLREHVSDTEEDYAADAEERGES